ncbi:MAG: hypothetical protein ACLSG9_10100 [Eubacterium sp.]
MCTPEEIKRYQKIYYKPRWNSYGAPHSRQRVWLSQAESSEPHSYWIRTEIDAGPLMRVSSIIMARPPHEAQRLVNAAQEESEQMRKAALLYTNDLCVEASGRVEEALQRRKTNSACFSVL